MTKQQWIVVAILALGVVCVYCLGGALVVQNFNPQPTQIAKPAEPTHVTLPTNIPEPTLTSSPTLTLLPPTITLTPMPADTPTLVLVQTVIPTVTRSPTVKLPTLSQTSTPSPVTQKPGRVTSQVSRVIDGDTIQVLIAGKTYTVRYIGIDTPETVAPGKPIEWMGAEASEANKSLVGGKSVDLEKDVSETDKYGRLLRYVFVGNVFVNAELVRKGYAKVSTYPPDVKNQSLFLQAQQEARTAGRGLWGIAPVLVSPPTQIPAPRAQPTIAPSRSGNCDSAYPDVCIPRYPPDLDCPEIPYENFRVLPPDPHRFDADKDGIGCEK